MAKELLAGFKATFIKKYSMEAVKDIPNESLDFVYIDGNHRYGFVKEDLWEWGKKVRVGGILSGHDYYEFRSGNKGVVMAVNEYVSAHKIDRWFITDERTPSFFWRKNAD